MFRLQKQSKLDRIRWWWKSGCSLCQDVAVWTINICQIVLTPVHSPSFVSDWKHRVFITACLVANSSYLWHFGEVLVVYNQFCVAIVAPNSAVCCWTSIAMDFRRIIYFFDFPSKISYVFLSMSLLKKIPLNLEKFSLRNFHDYLLDRESWKNLINYHLINWVILPRGYLPFSF